MSVACLLGKSDKNSGCKQNYHCDNLASGGVPERPKGSDCKSDGSAFEGSNPSPSTIFLCGLSSLG